MLITTSKLLQNIIELSSIFTKRYAGHSKWQNIRHIKQAKDAERSVLFTKLGSQMKVAIQVGGSADPKSNLKLQQVIENARRANMPVASIQSVIKSTQTDKTNAKAYLLEFKGPGSCFILCEVFTNNLPQLKHNLGSILRKHNTRFSDGGGLHLFEEKGVIQVELAASNRSEDTIVEEATNFAIEANAEDVKLFDNTLHFFCGKSNLNAVIDKLTPHYKVTSSTVDYIPIKLQTLQDSELEVAASLLDKLNGLQEVIRVSDNIE